MTTLIICASNPITFYLSKRSPLCKPKFQPFHNPRTTKQLNYYPLSTLKTHAGAKGFSSNRPSIVDESNDVTIKKRPINGGNNGGGDDDDEIPREVLYRIIGRILVSVGVPLALGLALLQLYGELKDRGIWDAPLWVPFLTTLITFGASALGIAYGALSSSLDAEREGSFLGLQEVQRNWVEMWKEEDSS